jgi:hypothetical protein
MFERFTDRARRVVVLAQEETRMLNHHYIGTEHILLGLIRDGEGVAARALESLGISLQAVRQQVEKIIGQGQQAPSGHIPFTPRAKKVLELSLRESRQLGHGYIGTEHILLGLIREGEGVAAQVLVRLGADLNRVRQQVIQLPGQRGTEPAAGGMGPPGSAGRATDLPSPLPRVHRERPKPPTRQFPDDSGPAGVIPGHASVDLTFERSRLLSGSVGGQPVRLELNVPTHNGVAGGTIAGIPVSATWVNGNNYYVYPDVPSELTGSFAGQPAELHATFHLEPDYFFDHGVITGHIGTEAFAATVEAAAPPGGGMGSSRTVAVDGTLGSTEFTIYATIDGPLKSGKLRGTVAGTPIRIDAARTHGPDGTQTRLTGSYQGPMALLALTAGALLHFI